MKAVRTGSGEFGQEVVVYIGPVGLNEDVGRAVSSGMCVYL